MDFSLINKQTLDIARPPRGHLIIIDWSLRLLPPPELPTLPLESKAYLLLPPFGRL